jgi:hypothetical protein
LGGGSGRKQDQQRENRDGKLRGLGNGHWGSSWNKCKVLRGVAWCCTAKSRDGRGV